MTISSLRPLLLALSTIAPFVASAAEPRPSVEPVKLAERLYTFTNTGSSSTALIGEESVLLVDAGSSAETGASLLAALATLTPKPVHHLVNTHWHFDHVNGNETVGAAGATIIAHSAVRARMIADKTREVSPGFPTLTYRNAALALPSICFDRELTLHSAGEEILLFHPATANVHTDGDTVVFFRRANVVHLGDLYFEGVYPFIDVTSGGSIDGMIAGCREILARIDDQTIVVPGHGPVTDKKHLEAYVEMLADISVQITALVQAGKTLEEVTAAKPTSAHDARWGRSWNSPDSFVALAYRGIVGRSEQ